MPPPLLLDGLPPAEQHLHPTGSWLRMCLHLLLPLCHLARHLQLASAGDAGQQMHLGQSADESCCCRGTAAICCSGRPAQ
jgi:hypothetical protein